MNLRTVKTATCQTCNGTANVPHPRYGEDRACSFCDGSGIRKRNGYGGYKTAANAAKALANGTGVHCRDCDGSGRKAYPMTNTCHACTDGLIVTDAMPGDAWPDDISRQVIFSHMRRGGPGQAYADAIAYSVQIQDRPGTWNEAYLGMGSIVSVTDYGRAYEEAAAGSTDRILAEAREAVSSTQWVKLTDMEGAPRRLATLILVVIHRNGWTVQAAVPSVPHMLPPTYTPDVLNRPMS